MRREIIQVILIGLVIIAFAVAHAGTTRVAIIDDGMSVDVQNAIPQILCEDGHKDFVTGMDLVGETLGGHGDLVTFSLVMNARRAKYCIMMYRINTVANVIDAINTATDRGAKFINISLTIGTYVRALDLAIKRASDKGIKIFVAAGNDKQNLNEVCNIYPQCLHYRNLIVIGATNPENELENYSNFGSIFVNRYKYGRSFGGARGTSFASPTALGEELQERYGY
jgi:hypothetical protein